MIKELALECTFCLIDHLPIDVSPAYRDLILCVGKENADRWTYVKEIPIIPTRPPPVGEHHGRHPGTIHQTS